MYRLKVWSKWQFCGFKMTKIEWQTNPKKFPHSVFPIRLPRSVEIEYKIRVRMILHFTKIFPLMVTNFFSLFDIDNQKAVVNHPRQFLCQWKVNLCCWKAYIWYIPFSAFLAFVVMSFFRHKWLEIVATTTFAPSIPKMWKRADVYKCFV